MGSNPTSSVAPPNTVLIYVGAIITLALVTVISIVSLQIARPEADNTSINTAIIGITGPLLLGMLGLIMRENHLQMNSRLDQLLTSTGNERQAEGKKEGRESAREEYILDLPVIAEAAAKLKLADAEALAKVLSARVAQEQILSSLKTDSVEISAHSVNVTPSPRPPEKDE